VAAGGREARRLSLDSTLCSATAQAWCPVSFQRCSKSTAC